MPTVVRTPLARSDFLEIVDYLLAHSEPAADRFTADVENACRLLATNPRMGRARNELAPGVRSVVVGNYVLFFRATATSVEVLRIFHGARNITPDLFADP